MPARLLEIEALKGILICLIVLGHNTMFSRAYPDAFAALYNFHVAAFLILPFLFFGQSVQGYQLKQRVTRYGVPHLWFFVLTCLLFFIFYRDHSLNSALQAGKEASLAVLFSTEGRYKTASGFGLFWFLPALICLLLIRSAVFSGKRWLQWTIIGGGIAAQLFVGWIPADYLSSIPFSLPLVLFLLPVGLLAGLSWRRWGRSLTFLNLCLFVFVACIVSGIHWNSFSALAGDPRVYSISEPGRLIFHDVYLFMAVFGLIAVSRTLPAPLSRVFCALGRLSLVIFLIHSLVWQALLRVGIDELMTQLQGRPLLGILLAFALTLGISAFLASRLDRFPRLKALIFPRDSQQWREAVSRKPAAA